MKKQLFYFAWRLALAQFLTITFTVSGNAQGPVKPEPEKVYIQARGIPDPAAVDGIYQVSANREIHLLRIGKVKLPNWGYAASALAIQKAYRDSGIYPNIEVSLGPSCSDADSVLGIDISGEVKMNQRSFRFFLGKTKLSDVLRQAGPKDSADLTRVEILRNGQIIVIDATQPDGLKSDLKENDIITVRAKK